MTEALLPGRGTVVLSLGIRGALSPSGGSSGSVHTLYALESNTHTHNAFPQVVKLQKEGIEGSFLRGFLPKGKTLSEDSLKVCAQGDAWDPYQYMHQVPFRRKVWVVVWCCFED